MNLARSLLPSAWGRTSEVEGGRVDVDRTGWSQYCRASRYPDIRVGGVVGIGDGCHSGNLL